MQNRFFSAVVVVAACVSAILCRPLPADEFVCELPNGVGAIKFVRLPPVADANIYAGMGSVAARQGVERYELPATFLAETELTLGQLKAFLSEEGWRQYRDGLLAVIGNDSNPESDLAKYRKAVVEGSDDYPAIMVSLKEVLLVCEAVSSLAAEKHSAQTQGAEVGAAALYKSFSCRLPSTVEWRFAAGARESIDALGPTQSFLNWPEFDAELLGKWADLCESLPGYRGDVAPTADQLCEVADSLGSKEGYELLGEVLKRSLGLEKHIAHLSEQGMLVVRQEEPSAWAFHRLFGNASELTLSGETVEEVNDLWASLIGEDADLSEDDRPAIVIMGGQYLNTVYQKEAWKKWSLLHGHTKSGEPFLIKDFCQEDSNGNEDPPLVNYKPGVRLCLREVLSPVWFVHYRSALRGSGEASVVGKNLLETAAMVCGSMELSDVQSVVRAYDSAAGFLWDGTERNEDEAIRSEEEVSRVLASAGAGFARQSGGDQADDDQVQADADALARIFGGGGGAGTGSKQQSGKPLGDGDFFEILQNLPELGPEDDI